MSQMLNLVTAVQTPSCGYQLVLSASTTAHTSLFNVDNANSRLQIGVFSDLSLLTTT